MLQMLRTTRNRWKKTFKTQKRLLMTHVYRVRFGRFENAVSKKLLTQVETDALITSLLNSERPFFIGRLGGYENGICWNFARARFGDDKHSQKWRSHATFNAGVSLAGDESLDRFAVIYLSAIPYLDLVGTWEKVPGMNPLLETFGSAFLAYSLLHRLDPWHAYMEGRPSWTQALKNKRVLVIHPFVRSIKQQFERKQTVKSIKDILPDFALETCMPPVTFAGIDNAKTWVSNLEALMAKVAAHSFDVAIIGCGAYGFPLGAFVKQLGRQAIHLGGSTQLLFGIRGSRWENQSYHSYPALMDETWVRPVEDERPPAANILEDSAYW